MSEIRVKGFTVRNKPCTRGLMGCDCEHYKSHTEPYYWVECRYKEPEYYKECKHDRSPWKCDNFKMRSKTKSKIVKEDTQCKT